MRIRGQDGKLVILDNDLRRQQPVEKWARNSEKKRAIGKTLPHRVKKASMHLKRVALNLLAVTGNRSKAVTNPRVHRRAALLTGREKV